MCLSGLYHEMLHINGFNIDIFRPHIIQIGPIYSTHALQYDRVFEIFIFDMSVQNY